MIFLSSIRRLLALVLTALTLAPGVAAADDPMSSWKRDFTFDKTDSGIAVRDARSGALVLEGLKYFFPEKDFAIVVRQDKYGVMDRSGKLLLPLEFDEIDSNDEARVFVVKRDGLKGLIAYDGSPRLPIEYESIDALARPGEPWVVWKNKRAGLIDPATGRGLLPIEYSAVLIRPPFVVGAIESDEKWSTIQTWSAFDLRGRPIPGCAATPSMHVWDAAALVVVDGTHAVDVDGKVVIAADRYDSIYPAGEAAIVRKGDKYGLIDKTGAPLTAIRYAKAWVMAERADALIAVQEDPADGGKARTGVFDMRGRAVVEPRWDTVGHETVKRADAQVDYFVVTRDGKTGSVGGNGETIFPPRFDGAERRDYSDPVYLVREGGRFGLCDMSTGKCPIPPIYDEISGIRDVHVDDELYFARRDKKYGVVSATNAVVVPFEFDRIKFVARGAMDLPDLEARKGFVTTRYRLTRDDDKVWRATPVPGSPIGEQAFDLHPVAAKIKPVVEARYLPEGMVSDQEVLAAAQAGRLRDAVYPSIQLSDRLAYVNFAQFPRKGRTPLPEVMPVCRETDGFRLLTSAKPDADRSTVCAHAGRGALRFRGDGESILACEGCKALGLPERWRRADAAPRSECATTAGKAWDAESARQEYAEWLTRWKRESPAWLAPKDSGSRSPSGSIDDLGQSVDTRSRAIGTLAVLSLEPERMADLLEDPAHAVDWTHIGEALTAMLASAEPVGGGGLYPEQDKRYAKVCAEVWYMKLPEIEAAEKSGAKVPGLAAYGLPRPGMLQRNAYPFLNFTRDHGKVRLAGISREFLQALLWREFGPCGQNAAEQRKDAAKPSACAGKP